MQPVKMKLLRGAACCLFAMLVLLFNDILFRAEQYNVKPQVESIEIYGTRGKGRESTTARDDNDNGDENGDDNDDDNDTVLDLGATKSTQTHGARGREPPTTPGYDNGTAPDRTITKSNRRVIFVPFPHRLLGSGTDAQCQWKTMGFDVANDITSGSEPYDMIQRSAFEEGVCIPPHPHLNASIHVFSSAEAIDCLRHPNTVVMSGDSYTKQLFIGLADILLSTKLDKDKQMLNASQRRKTVAQAQQWLDRKRKENPSFPRVQFTCLDECYGKSAPFSSVCSRCINHIIGQNDTSVAVVGSGIHFGNRVEQINKFLDLANRTIYVPMPHALLRKVLPEYKAAAPKKNLMKEEVYRALLPNLAPHNMEHPFLDVYQLTRSCTMDNCTYDGGHKSRYVNRWKAQLLLNTLCEVKDH